MNGDVKTATGGACISKFRTKLHRFRFVFDTMHGQRSEADDDDHHHAAAAAADLM